jgi:hypothetical protein
MFRKAPANFGVKLMRPGFGPAAELPASPPARRRHGGCSSPLGSSNVIGGNRRAAQASARGAGRTAYTKDVRPTNDSIRGGTLSMKLRLRARSTQGTPPVTALVRASPPKRLRETANGGSLIQHAIRLRVTIKTLRQRRIE